MIDLKIKSLREQYIEKTSGVLDALLMLLGLILVVVLILVVGAGITDLYTLITNLSEFEATDAINLVDSLLIGLIVIEIFRNIEAYLKGMSIIPVAINVAILAVARQVILHRPETFETGASYLYTGLTYAAMMGILLAAYYITTIMEPGDKLQQETEKVM